MGEKMSSDKTVGNQAVKQVEREQPASIALFNERRDAGADRMRLMDRITCELIAMGEGSQAVFSIEPSKLADLELPIPAGLRTVRIGHKTEELSENSEYFKALVSCVEITYANGAVDSAYIPDRNAEEIINTLKSNGTRGGVSALTHALQEHARAVSLRNASGKVGARRSSFGD